MTAEMPQGMMGSLVTVMNEKSIATTLEGWVITLLRMSREGLACAL
jgi:hypothetical protein